MELVWQDNRAFTLHLVETGYRCNNVGIEMYIIDKVAVYYL